MTQSEYNYIRIFKYKYIYLLVYDNINNFIKLNRIILEKDINLNTNNYKNIEFFFKSY